MSDDLNYGLTAPEVAEVPEAVETPAEAPEAVEAPAEAPSSSPALDSYVSLPAGASFRSL